MLGTLAVTPLSADFRPVEVIAFGGAWPLYRLSLAASRRDFASSYCSPWSPPHPTPTSAKTASESPVRASHRALRGDAARAAKSPTTVSTALTLALDDGTIVLARVRTARTAARNAADRARTARAVRRRAKSRRAERTRDRARARARRTARRRRDPRHHGLALESRRSRSRARTSGRTTGCAIVWANRRPRCSRANCGANVRRCRRICATEFQETGTVHVLVTAGLHLGAVAAALPVRAYRWLALPRWLTCALAIALAWALRLVERRAVAGRARRDDGDRAALAARAFGRATFSWNALAVAAIVVAFAAPAERRDASFALSFSCVGAIFACADADRALDRSARRAAPARARRR